MSSFTNKAQVGDVVTSPDFAFSCSERERLNLIRVGKFPSYAAGQMVPERARAQYVVFETRMTPDSCGHSAGDSYPGYWEVKARRLKNDGTYDPQGEAIIFSMADGTWLGGAIAKVKIVRKMTMVFV